jgi:nitrate reductase alpha subunit
MGISRRRFLQTCTTAGGALLAAGPQAWAFDAVSIENPLGAYPNQEWEKIYLDQYTYDRTFTWVCAPNDTHMC